MNKSIRTFAKNPNNIFATIFFIIWVSAINFLGLYGALLTAYTQLEIPFENIIPLILYIFIGILIAGLILKIKK